MDPRIARALNYSWLEAALDAWLDTERTNTRRTEAKLMAREIVSICEANRGKAALAEEFYTRTLLASPDARAGRDFLRERHFDSAAARPPLCVLDGLAKPSPSPGPSSQRNMAARASGASGVVA